MRSISALAVFILIQAAPSAAEPLGLTVKWQGGTINYPRETVGEKEHGAPDGKWEKVDCGFMGMKTDCWNTRKRVVSKKYTEPYGKNLKFVKPVAIFPMPVKADEASEDPQWFLPGKESLISKLKPFSFPKLSEGDKLKILNDGPLLGTEFEAHAFAQVSETMGGNYVLDIWKSLLGKKPTRECLADDYCAIVVDGSFADRDALVYCQIMNSKIGLGIPFNCETVAYKYKAQDQWFVRSYDGPEQCDGCGAAEGASCSLPTQATIETVADILVKALKAGRTNIQLTQLKKSKHSIELIGQNEGTVSKFYANYYDKSYASYSVSRSEDDQTQVQISGLFNLLISVSPTAGGKNYREIGSGKGASDPDIVWFQGEVLDIVKKDVASKLGVKADCMVQPIY